MYNIYAPPPIDRGLYVYDRDIEWQATVEGYESLTMERSLFGVGSFSLEVSTYVAGVESLIPGNYLCLGQSDARVGIVGKVVDKSSEGKDTVLVTGYMLKGIAAKRIIVPPTETEFPDSFGWEFTSGSAEEVLRHYFDLQCVNPRNPIRAIPRVVMDDLHSPPRGPHTPWLAEHREKLPDVLRDIGEWTQYGWDVRLDIPNKRLVFVVVPLRDMTQDSGASPVLFSREIGNLGDYELSLNRQDYANSIFIGGKDSTRAQFVQTAHIDEDGQQVDDPWEGIDRGEAWISAGNLDTPEELIFEGLHKHNAQKKPIETVKATAYNTDAFRYGHDWDVGDKVSVMVYPRGRERRLDTQVTKVVEVYEKGPGRIDVTFGNEVPTPRQTIDQIRKMI